MTSEYDAERTMEDLAGDAEREAVKHKAARDKYSRQAQVLIDKRNQLQDMAKKLSSEARYMRDRRDDYNLSASEARGKRDEWNDRAATMRARGGLGDIGEARSQSSNYHQKAVKFSNSGQLAHEKMKQLQEEANSLREQAQVYHEQAMELRKAADAEHELYIKAKRRAQNIRESPQRDRLDPFFSEETTLWTMLNGMPVSMAMSRLDMPFSYFSRMAALTFSSTSTAFLGLSVSGMSRYHSVEEHLGQRRGSAIDLDVHVLPHLRQWLTLGGTSHWWDPHWGHLFGVPLWEFQVYPHLWQVTVRWGIFHLTDLQRGHLSGSRSLLGTQM